MEEVPRLVKGERRARTKRTATPRDEYPGDSLTSRRRIRFRSRGSTDGSFHTRGKSAVKESSCSRVCESINRLLLRLLIVVFLRFSQGA